MKIVATFILSIIGLSSFSQGVNLVSADSIRVNLNAEPGVFSDILNFRNELVLRVRASQSTRTPALYMAKCKVREGAQYTYVVKAGPNSSGKVALYVTSPEGNIGWPGTFVNEGQVTQTFTVPAGTDQVTLAIAFWYPQANDSVYLKAIGLFEGISVSSNWTEHDDADAMRTFLTEALKTKEARAKEMEDTNLATFYNLSELKIEGDLRMSVEHTEKGDFLKVVCLPSRYTPSIYFKKLHVVPGHTYTYFISLITEANLNAYVTMPSGNLIWPGVKLSNGINKQSVPVPEGVNEITIALTFSSPSQDFGTLSKDQTQTVLIGNVGFYKGDIDPILWNSNFGGLQPLMKPSRAYLLGFLFPMAVAMLVILYMYDKKKRTSFL
jgi:hypothetical protein